MDEIENGCKRRLLKEKKKKKEVLTVRTLLLGVTKGRTTFTVCCGQDVSENGANDGTHLRYYPNEVS